MIHNIKYRIALLIANFKYLRKQNEVIRFSHFFRESKTFLIILPETEVEVANSNIIINFLLNNDRLISVLINDGKKNILNLSSRIEIYSYKLSDCTIFDLPGKEIVKTLSNRKFDVVIDLTISETLFCAVASNLCESKYKVGLFKEKYKYFYNIHFNYSENNSKILYENLLNSFSMF